MLDNDKGGRLEEIREAAPLPVPPPPTSPNSPLFIIQRSTEIRFSTSTLRWESVHLVSGSGDKETSSR